MEDQDNNFYDPRMIPSDKTLLAEWLHKIRRIKRKELPAEYLEMREDWLKKAEQERIKNGTVPTALHDVEPPYDKGKGLAPHEIRRDEDSRFRKENCSFKRKKCSIMR